MIFGGVTEFTKEQFRKVNGFPNQYFGWGGEARDFLLELNFDDNRSLFLPFFSSLTGRRYEHASVRSRFQDKPISGGDRPLHDDRAHERRAQSATIRITQESRISNEQRRLKQSKVQSKRDIQAEDFHPHQSPLRPRRAGDKNLMQNKT